METLKRVGGGIVLGAGWGAVSSLTNAADSPAGRVASLIANAGWAWAAVAVAAGWLAGTFVRGAVAGALALVAATAAYYGTDAALRQEPFASYRDEMRAWWLAGVVLGSALGAVGASIRRPGVVGLVAGLTVPVGAAVEMAWLPRWPGGADADPALGWARLLVWAAAAAIAGGVVARFLLAARRRRPR